ncbi:MAG: PIN domain nuclease [Ilumatobacteraceae bacterium]
MIFIDTSAWIEFLRNTSSPACNEVDRQLASDIAICDVVLMELLAGARDESHLRQLRGLIARTTVLPVQTTDYETAALLYRRCRSNGDTVRRLVDCVIGAVALRNDLPVLHHDADFDTLARHTDVRVHKPRERA